MLLAVFGSLLALLLLRAGTAPASGFSGEGWPFALLLALMTVYEVAWLRFVRGSLREGREIAQAMWAANIFVESLLPTTALFLQNQTHLVSPERALTSPIVSIYFLFIILSALRLDPGLSHLSGAVSAAGYGAVSAAVLLLSPEASAGGSLLAYGTSTSYVVLLFLGGLAAGAVASQIRRRVIAALREADSRAKAGQVEHDRGIASSIQQGLLPKTPPRVHGFDIAGWNKPADETGADYFDWQQLADGHIAVTVADVTGHGIGPALYMTACRAYVRAAFTTESDLQSVLGHVNRLLCEDLPPERFVTLVAGVLNPWESSLQLISGGHGPLLFYSAADERFLSFDAQGLPLGLVKDYGYDWPHVLKFSPGDVLVLVTDGFIQWANANDECFGQDRLKDVIRLYHDRTAATIITELYAAATHFAGSMPQLDDLTVLIVRKV